MIVWLKRDLFLEGTLYKSSRFGVEIPDEVAGKAVIFSGDPLPKKPYIILPKDAERLDKVTPTPPAKDQTMALSEMTRKAAKSASFVDAMKSDDED